MLNRFSRTIILLAKLNNLIRDKFFYDKLGNKIQVLLSGYIIFSGKSGDSVAQHQVAYEKFTENIDDVLEMLEELKYLNLLGLSPLFLQNQKNLLTLKLEIRERANKPEVSAVKITGETQEEKQINKQVAVESIVKKNTKLNQSKKKILDFIRSSPNTRTKDIISEFNALSDRTVKRNLTDLLHTGLIKKRVDSKAVYYYASE